MLVFFYFFKYFKGIIVLSDCTASEPSESPCVCQWLESIIIIFIIVAIVVLVIASYIVLLHSFIYIEINSVWNIKK